jgi:hypothetical protein
LKLNALVAAKDAGVHLFVVSAQAFRNLDSIIAEVFEVHPGVEMVMISTKEGAEPYCGHVYAGGRRHLARGPDACYLWMTFIRIRGMCTTASTKFEASIRSCACGHCGGTRSKKKLPDLSSRCN